jgi:hypothetical protein
MFALFLLSPNTNPTGYGMIIKRKYWWVWIKLLKGDFMRARVRRNNTIALEKLKDFFTTVLLHLTFYAFIIFLVMFFINNFS